MAISAPRDANRVPTLIGTSSVDGTTPTQVYVDPTTHRMLVDASGSTPGTVTSVSVTSANGFAGTVATATTTPAITLSTTITGVLKGNGTAISAATNADLPAMTATVGGAVPTPPNNTTTFLRGDGTFAAPAGGGITVGTTTITSGTTTRVLYNNAGVVGEYTLTGSGTVNVMQTAPSLLTSLAMDTGFVMNWASSNVVLTHTSGILTLGTGTLKITTPTNTTTSVVTIDGTQSLTNKTYNGNTFTAGTGTLTIAAAKTLTVSNSVTLAGTDSTTMTFPTTSKTLAANDGSNLTIASQAIGDILTATSTTAYGRLAAVAVGSVLSSAGTGTAPAWSSAPQITTIELGAASDTTLARVSAGVISVEGVTVPTISSTSTITNKRNQPRIVSAASYTTDTGTSLDVSTTDIFIVTAQAGALKFNNPSGTPVQGEKLMIRIKDNGTARALTYDTQFRASSDLALPTTTVLSKTLYMGFIYNSTDTKWDLLAVLNNF